MHKATKAIIATALILFAAGVGLAEEKAKTTVASPRETQARARSAQEEYYDYLHEVKDGGQAYERFAPHFTLFIPAGTLHRWYFQKINAPGKAFFIASQEYEMFQTTPFITSSIERLTPAELKEKPITLFEETAFTQKEREEEISKGKRKTVKKGTEFTLNGAKAYGRIFQFPSKRQAFHSIYILVGDYFFQVLLNTTIENFKEDNEDFKKIVQTFYTWEF